jgi:hypothetical protein
VKLLIARKFADRHAVVVQCISAFLIETFLLLPLASCKSPAPFDSPPPVHSIQDAATVHIAPLSVSRWEDYRAALQPQFPITAATALTLALPQTSISQARFSEALNAGLQLGLPQSTQTNSLAQSQNSSTAGNGASTSAFGTTLGTADATGTNATNGVTTTNSSAAGKAATNGSSNTTSTVTTSGGVTTTQTSTSQNAPGTLPPNLLVSTAVPNAAALGSPTGTVAMDPLLTYQAATAIYQEIQLLNAYVNDAVQRYGYVPYVARMQVSVVPTAHLEPYDVYVDLGFFSRCKGQRESTPVVVVPLLVTDDVETGQASSAVESARQLAASLGGITGNVAVQAGLSQLKSAYNAILGTDYNSLYMATHATDNVIQIRLGAARNPNPNVKYAMLTQTHDVSFLMLVKKKYVDGDSSCYVQPPVADEGVKADTQLHAVADFKNNFRQFLEGTHLTHAEFARYSEDGYIAIDQAAQKSLDQANASATQAARDAILKQATSLKTMFPAAITDENISDLLASINQSSQEAQSETQDGRSTLGPQVWVTGYTRMRNAVTGKELPSDVTIAQNRAKDVMKHFVEPAVIAQPTYESDVQSLIDAVQRNDSTRFARQFCHIMGNARANNSTCDAANELPVGLADAAWTGLASVISMKEYSGTYFNLPKRHRPLPYQDQTIFIQDSCKLTASVALGGFGSWTTSDFKASLLLDTGVRLTATSITQPLLNGPFTIQFPSLKPFGLVESVNDHKTIFDACPHKPDGAKLKGPATPKDPAPAVKLEHASLFIEQLTDDRWNGNNAAVELSTLEFRSVYYSGSTADLETSVSVTAATDTITAVPNPAAPNLASTAQLRLQLKVGKDLQDVVLSFGGATLASVPSLSYVKAAEGKLPDGSLLPFASLDITPPDKIAFGPTPITVDVNLQGITATRAVTITATGRDVNKKVVGVTSFAIPVIAPPASNNPSSQQTQK